MIVNVTWNGMSADLGDFPDRTPDAELKELAVGMIRTGDVPGMFVADLPRDTFANYVVDRFRTAEGGERAFLRPKVPFGATSQVTYVTCDWYGCGEKGAQGGEAGQQFYKLCLSVPNAAMYMGRLNQEVHLCQVHRDQIVKMLPLTAIHTALKGI